jgi:hypothetical protein
MLATLLGASRLFEGQPPTLGQAKALATGTDTSINAQEARGLAIIAGLQTALTDSQAALALAKENEVDAELIELLTKNVANAEDNFVTIAPDAARKAGVKGKRGK